MSPAYAAFGDIGHESDDDETKGLPEAFAGQEIEDLAYGAGPDEAEIEQEVMNGWFEEEDEEVSQRDCDIGWQSADRQDVHFTLVWV